MSAILSADDLNDFISPGVACIKPVETLPPPPPSPPESLEHEVFRDDGPNGPNGNGGAAPAQISLTDCLACSGCVTSAEAVLVSLQSHAEVLRALDAGPALDVTGADGGAGGTGGTDPDIDGGRLFVASVSPQTRANLAAACGPGVSEAQAGHMLEHLLAGPDGLRAGGAFGNGFAWVVDTNAARNAVLVLGADEALQQRGRSDGPDGTDGRRPPGPAGASAQAAPLLASSCPGWVCYAEKTHPHVLGHLSRVKSPQALTGTLLKTVLSRALGIRPDRIWHVAIMPCFDKKLEASRSELTDAVWGERGRGAVRDVDCVITSKEVLMLAASRGIDFFSLPKTSPYGDSRAAAPSPSPSLRRPPFPDAVLDRFLFGPLSDSRGRCRPPVAAGSSGGNLHFILQSVLAQNPGATLHTARGRNVDVVEYSVMAAGAPIFKAARYYGFRNIQNLVRRLKPARPSRLPGGRPVGSARRAAAGGAGAGLDYAYVEVMACPGGCTNGGGQIKADDPVVVARRTAGEGQTGPVEQKAWLAEIDEAYFSADDDGEDDRRDDRKDRKDDGVVVDGIRPQEVRDALAHWAQITGIDLATLAYTTFREVVSDVGKGSSRKAVGGKAGVGKVGGGDAAEHVVQLASKIGGGW